MSKIFFTGDKHHQHDKILDYDNRPFKSIDEHDSKLIFNHNSMVKKDDICYDLGDFYFRGGKEASGRKVYSHYLNQYNGRYVIIRGNHERNNKVVDKIFSANLNMFGIRIFLVHDPLNSKVEADLNIVAHVHNWFKEMELQENGKKSLIINVGVTQWKYRPVTAEQIYTIYCRWKKGLIKPEVFDKQALVKFRTERKNRKE